MDVGSRGEQRVDTEAGVKGKHEGGLNCKWQ